MILKLIAVFFFLFNIVSAQSDTSKTYFLKEFRISGVRDTIDNNVLKKKKFTYKDLNRVKIMNDTFEFGSAVNKNIYRLSPNEIKKISIRDGNYLFPAAGYSALAGLGLGLILGGITVKAGHPSFTGGTIGLSFGIALALTFGIIGGLFGAATPHFIDMDLTKNGINDNELELRKIIIKNSKKLNLN